MLRSWRATAAALALLLVAAALPFLGALGAGFTNWDDAGYVAENPTIRALSPSALARLAVEPQMGNWHPATMLAYALQHRLFGASAAGYHLVSVLLHLACVGVLFRLLCRWAGSGGGAFAGALLFAVHPLRVEPVAWVSGQKDLLAALFALLALLAWESAAGAPNRERAWRAAALALSCAALAAKATVVTLPALLWLRDRALPGARRPHGSWYAAFAAPAAAVAGVALWTQRQTVHQGGAFPWYEGLFTAAHGLLFYAAKTLFPAGLSAVYPYPGEAPGRIAPELLFAPAALALLVALGWRFVAGRPQLRFGLLFFATALAPTLQLVPVGYAHAADRYAYFPAAGLAVVVAAAAGGFGQPRAGARASGRALPALLLAVMALALGGAARQRSAVWADTLALWDDVLSKHPGDPLALTNRGAELCDRGRPAAALADFDLALRREASYRAVYRHGSATLHFNRGIALAALGRRAEALQAYTRALELDPGVAVAWNNRGALHDQAGRHDEAIADYDRALAISPDAPDYLGNRCLARLGIGDAAGALADCSRALAMDPAAVEPRYQRSRALAALGRRADALADLDAVLAREPRDGQARLERARLRRAAGDVAGALADLSALLASRPAQPALLLERGTLLLLSGDAAAAEADLTRALELDGSLAEAWSNRGAARARQGRLEAALADFERALALRPDHAGAAANHAQALRALREERGGAKPRPAPAR